MKTIGLVLIMLITVSIGFAQEGRETVRQVEAELQVARWVEIGKDNGFPVSINANHIQRFNGLVMFRAQYDKRNTKVYSSVFGNCTQDTLLIAPVGWARYAGNPKLVSVTIDPISSADENGIVKVEPDTLGWVALDYACNHPSSIKVFD